MKTCFRCEQSKPFSEFYPHGMMADGYLGKCKECAKKDVLENRKIRRQQYREYEARRLQLPERKEKLIRYQRERRIRDPQKYLARMKVGNAVRDGKLKRMPCEVCGNEKTQAHHDDYSKPLDVRWLCFEHHRNLHGQTVG